MVPERDGGVDRGLVGDGPHTLHGVVVVGEVGETGRGDLTRTGAAG